MTHLHQVLFSDGLNLYKTKCRKRLQYSQIESIIKHMGKQDASPATWRNAINNIELKALRKAETIEQVAAMVDCRDHEYSREEQAAHVKTHLQQQYITRVLNGLPAARHNQGAAPQGAETP